MPEAIPEPMHPFPFPLDPSDPGEDDVLEWVDEELKGRKERGEE